MTRKIIHIDMDAFYAAVEQRDNPMLKGKPVIVGGSPNSRGVVSTASYEARKFGVHSAMSCAQAYKLCKKAIFIEPNFVKYKKASSQIRAIFKEYSDIIEPLSLDEAYIDVTKNKKNIPSATKIANEIRKKIWSTLRLTASAGVAPNKFLAKIASDINKPNGTKVIPPKHVEHFIETLPIGKFFGIGKVTKEKMLKLGIKNGADLKQLTLTDITYHFGKMGKFYYDIVRGIDNRDICPDRVRKSIGAEITFPKDISNISTLYTKLHEIGQMVENRLKKEKAKGKTITLKVRYDNFKRASRSFTSEFFLSSISELIPLAKDLLRKTEAGKRPIRLLGITISNLNLTTTQKNNSPQLELPF